jgi:hypothetical protein
MYDEDARKRAFENFEPRRNPPHLIKLPPHSLGCHLDSLSPLIPRNAIWRCPTARFIYLARGIVVAQGIAFYGAPNEQYLILVRKSKGKQWIWTTELPAHDKRKCIWKAGH